MERIQSTSILSILYVYSQLIFIVKLCLIALQLGVLMYILIHFKLNSSMRADWEKTAEFKCSFYMP